MRLPPAPEIVLLIHGIVSSKWLMWPLAKRLERHGFETRLYTYFTLGPSNRRHGERFAEQLRRVAPKYERVHVVAHSMGSIVTRCALQEALPENFGRVVMIGPPNRGSHIATRVSPLFGWLSPTLRELRDTPDSFVNQLPAIPVGREVGVLAAAKDHLVLEPSTHVAGERDHRVIGGWHESSLWRRQTAEQVAHFLRTGVFQAE